MSREKARAWKIPVGKSPAAKSPAWKSPGGEKSGGEKSGGEKSGGENSVCDAMHTSNVTNYDNIHQLTNAAI